MTMSRNRALWSRSALPACASALLVAAAVGALVVGGGTTSFAAASDSPAANTVTVSGMGVVSGKPDVLRLDLGVQRTAQNVSAALAAANDDIRKIKAALAEHGVKDEDIQTSQLSINPHYDQGGYGYDSKPMPAPAPAVEPMPAPASEPAPEREDAPETDPAPPLGADTVAPPSVGRTSPAYGGGMNGYDVYETLTVKLRKLDDAGAAISDAAEAGGNATRINGVSFDIEDDAGLLRSARDAAFADAKTKAEQYARLSGRSLGRVAQINENSYDAGPVMYGGMARDEAAAGSSVPIQPGSQQVSISNTVVWELT